MVGNREVFQIDRNMAFSPTSFRTDLFLLYHFEEKFRNHNLQLKIYLYAKATWRRSLNGSLDYWRWLQQRQLRRTRTLGEAETDEGVNYSNTRIGGDDAEGWPVGWTKVEAAIRCRVSAGWTMCGPRGAEGVRHGAYARRRTSIAGSHAKPR